MKRIRLKRSLVVFLSLCLAVCCTILCVHISKENKLDKIQQVALETLNENIDTYDENTIVLNSTNRASAENLANKLGAKLRITSNGDYATLTLQNGMTVRDVYEDRENRALLENFSLDYYSKTSDIEEQEPVRQTTAPKYTVRDSLYSYQSYLDYLHIENAWDNYKGSGITVAVIDTGIDIDHPEFSGKISEYSYNATDDKIVKDYTLEDGSYDWSLIDDEQGHGTSVAGVIAASMDGNGIVGIAPEVTLLVIKAECDEKGNFLRTSDLIFGLYYAIERDADVVNMSFGSGSNVFSAPARLANDSDVTLIAAAGNDSTSELTFPAADENVIGVGALEDGGWNLAAYSNFGDNTDIVAPGTVYTTTIGGGYRIISGTSFASPITAAAVALLKSQNKYIENDSVKELLYASSYDLGGLGKDFYYGYGALDISALILEERGTVTFDMLTDELEDITQIFIRNHTLQNVPEPDRNYAVFDGWYYDIHCTDELNLYSDVWTSDLTLYANWVNEDDGVPYTYVILDDGTVEIRSYTGHRRYITVPDKIEDRVVSSIGDFAFSGETRLREVNLPRGLKKIGLNAFANCTNLFTMSIPDGVEEIGANTFANDSRLNAISFGQNSKLKTIGDFAFQNCGLFNFELPIRLENVNGSAFVGCTRLTNFSVRKGNKSFIEQSGVLYTITKSTIVAFPAGKNVSEYTLPDETLTVGTCAFAYAKTERVNLKNVQSIEDSAFFCSSLTAIAIPDSVVLLGKLAFAYNFKLKSIIIGEGISTLPLGVFKMDSSLIDLKIPRNVQSIMGGQHGAFENCISLTSVTFEENSKLSYIGVKSFASTNIAKITLPKNVVMIDSKAFTNNFNLSDVSLETGSVLRTISNEAFAYTYSLTNITLPENLVAIGDFAFIDSGLSSVTIPKTVAELGKGAFASCHSLENIFIESGNENYVDTNGVVYSKDKTIVVEYPAGKNSTEYEVIDGVKKIGNCAFYGAWNLNTVYLPDGVESVGEYAFYDCENVTSYSLPETLTAIERYAFSENYSLNYISIPDNVVQISNYAFAYDYNLNTIYLRDSSKLPRISFAAFAYTGITSMRIPANVSTIAQYAFTGSNSLQTVTFAANSKLDIIPAYMFKGANNITNITFESGSALTSIAAHGFEGMRRLTSVDFGDAKLKTIDNYAFRYCESLQTVNIPDGVASIGRFAFYGCKSLARLDLPESIDYIGRFAFYFAENLNVYFKADTLPANLQENWDYGIAGYYVGVTDVLESGDWKYATLSTGGISIIKYTGSETILDLTALDFGGKIKQIGGYAFAYSKITSIVLPETLEIIQRYAFANSKLESVIIPSNVSFIGQYAFFNTPVKTVTFGENSSLLKIEQYAFSYTNELEEIIIPNSIEEMQSYVFYRSGIKKVTFENGAKLTKIAAHAFALSGLLSVTIPDNVNYIDDNAFRDCLSLQTVTFGAAENLRVHANAFYNTAISSLYIPANMEYVGEYAFIGLENLENYVVSEDNPYYKSIDGVLYEKDGKKLIAFPAGRTGSFVVPSSVETIGFGAFENTKIEDVSFEEGINLLTLGYRAFYNAKNLMSVSVPASVVSIDYYAFAECRNLETVAFAEDNLLTGIYEGAFLNCISLKNIIIPDSIIEISDYAFYGCSSLTRLPFSATATVKGIYDYAFAYTGIRELIIPETVTDIGAYAFCGSKVKTVLIPDTQKDVLIIGIGALQDCDELEELDIPFSGASLSDGETRVWFGYIFGAGAVEANSVYMPKALKTVAITQIKENSWKRIFGNCYNNNLESIESVVLPIGLTNIGDMAFRGCNVLVNIEIPSSVTSIDGGAFSYCIGLTSMEIPDGVTIIGVQAFYKCNSLTSIEMPDSVTSIGDEAFYECGSLTKIKLSNSVTSIDSGMFRGCSRLKSIKIPDNVTKIDSYAFYGCSGLTSIEIPNSVMSISDCAFYDCKGLTSVGIGKNVASIGTIAFSGCNNLYQIKNDSDLQLTIGSNDYGEIAYYAKVIIDKNGNKTYRDDYNGFVYIDLADGFRFMQEKSDEKYKLISYLGSEDTVILPLNLRGQEYDIYKMTGIKNVILPEGMTKIGDSAFYGCSSLISIKIPDSVTNIGWNAFSGCSNLKNIEIPNSVTSVGGRAFDECVTLTSIKLPNDIVSIDEYAFNKCGALKNIKIPNNVTSIGNFAFSYCSSLTSIEIPDSVKNIGIYAFSGCSELTSIEISNNITNIGRYAFFGCRKLTRLNFPKTLIDLGNNVFSGCEELTVTVDEKNECFSVINCVLYNKDITNMLYICPSVKNLVVPSTVTSFGGFRENKTIQNIDLSKVTTTSIEQSMFSGCSALVSIKMPDGVKSIGNRAFLGCSELTAIDIPDSVTSIGYEAFSGCSGLTAIEIPNSVTSIGYEAFLGCSGLTSIAISNNVTSIADELFWGCNRITIIEIPNSVQSIGDSVFYGCSGLTGIKIPESVTSIGNSVFYGCSGLTDIKIPESVTSIGDSAFYDCSGLTSIEIPHSVMSISDCAFWGCNNLYQIKNNSDLQLTIGSNNYGEIAYYAKVIIDKNGNKTYRDDYNGFIYIDTTDGFRFMQEKTGAKYKLISYFGSEDTVTLPLNINGESYEIYHMNGAKNIIVPSSIAHIGRDSFANYDGLLSIVLPNSITSIESYAFSSCSGLTTIEIPNGVTSIGDFAFRYCKNLKSVNISDGLQSIGYGAFFGCNELTSIEISNSITSIGANAFEDTAFFNNDKNWKDGLLFIGKHLISVAEEVDRVVVPLDTICIAGGAFSNCQRLKSVTIGGNRNNILNGVTNVETLIITSVPTEHNIFSYFGGQSEVPITLKTLVLQKSCTITHSDEFEYITDVTIYVENQKIATQWDHDYPGWNNGNKVYYGGEWINAEFKNADGKIISSEYYTVSQVIRQPFVADIPNGKTKFVFVGWDIDGDGIADGVPATSTHNISVTAVMKEVDNECVINFYDYFGNLYDTKTYVYGETIVLPENPVKKGYVFNGWRRYEVGAVATESMDYYSVWSHDGEGHNYGVKTVAPTCETDGYDLHICSICDDEYRDNYVVASGHQFGDWIIDAEATCEGNGLRHHICSVCNVSVSEEISAHGHEYIVDSKIEASCSHQGKKVYACLYCGNTVEETTPMLEHEYEKKYASKSWIEWLIDRLLNIFFGYEGNDAFYYRCVNCGHIQTMAEASNSATAAGTCEHELGDWKVSLAPSCVDGVSVRECAKCGKVIEAKVLEANGEHVYDEWIVTKNATCTNLGLEQRNCKNCSHYETRELKALGHNYSTGWTEDIAPTCTTAGSKSHHCTRCDDKADVAVVEALGHKYGEWKETKAPTCTATGTEEHECSVCHNKETRMTEAKGHTAATAVVENKVEPICTADGHYDSVVYCSVCHEELSRETKTISALGHKESAAAEENRVEATCTKAGHYDSVVYCSVCKAEISREQKTIAATGHTEAVDEAVAATCTETGLTEGKHCSVCYEVLKVQDVIPALGHDYGEWTTVKDATENESGEEERVCKICSHREQRENPPLGIGAFKTAVADLVGKKNQDLFDALKIAIELYNNLSDENKQLVQEDYQKLKAVIVSYNENVVTQNAEFETANETALYMFVANLSILAAIVYILKRKLL